LLKSQNREISQDFVTALLAEDELGVVVRAHIHIENRVIEYLNLLMVESKLLADAKLGYYQKVLMMCALGFEPGFKSAFVKLGEMRNKFSHDLNAKLTAKTVADLYTVLPAFGKAGVKSALTATKSLGNYTQFDRVSDLPPREKFILIAINLERIVFAASELIEEMNQKKSSKK
jgi:hypothetical protein